MKFKFILRLFLLRMLSILFSTFFFAALSSQYGFDHIYNVDATAVPSYHQKDFVRDLLQSDKRRALLEQEDFFLLTNVLSDDGEHDFLVKPAMTNQFMVSCATLESN